MIMTTPFYSVVIPTFNRSSTIEPTLRSVQTQTFEDFECLIIDDGSSDVDQLEALVAGLNDERFRVIRRENGGGGAARNTGIDESAGSYIAFLDSDDLFLPEKLYLVHSYIIDTGASALYSYAYVDRGNGARWIRPDRGIAANESVATYLFIANQFIQTSTIVISTDLAKKIRFDPDLRKGQDLDFCLRADVQGVEFKMLERPMIVWTDVSEVGRTSRHAGADAPKAWLASHSNLMSPREILGYRATVLAYYQPKYLALSVIKDLLLAVLVAGVPIKVAMRHFLRFVLPKSTYRALVQRFLATSAKAKIDGSN